MADPVKRNALLPPIGTPREWAIGEANAAAGEIDNDIVRRAGSPDISEVPAEYLSARAEARSVDVWDPLWPDDIKRAAIVAAPIVHRHKGTVLAVKTALSALKIDATVTEWWQETPRGAPYTFTVHAYARARLYDGPLLDARLIGIAYAAVMRAKPESRAFDLTIGASFPYALGIAAAASARVPVRSGVRPRVDTAFREAMAVAPIFAARQPVRGGVLVRPDTLTRAVLGLAPAFAVRVRLSHAVIPILPT